MGYPNSIGRVYVKEQAGGAGTPETSFSAANTIGAEVILPPLVREALASASLRGAFHAPVIVPGSREGAEFAIAHILQGWSLTTPTATPTAHPDALLCKSALGGAALGGYSSGALSGGTEAVPQFDDGTLAASLSGLALLLPLTGGGRGIAWVKTVDTASTPDAFTAHQDLLAAPDGTGTPVVYGSNTIFMSQEAPTHFTAQWIGADSNAAVRFSDCVCTGGKLTLAHGQQPRIEHQVRAGYWDLVGGAAMAAYLLSHPELPAVVGANGARLVVANVEALLVPTVEIEWKATVEPRGSLTRLDGNGGYDVTDRQVTITVLEYSSNMATEAAAAVPGSSPGQLQIDVCTTPGRAVSVIARNPQVASQRTFEARNGVVATKTVYNVRPYFDDSAGGDGANAPFSIAFM